MSETPETQTKKPIVSVSISRWIMGVLIAGISALYLDSRRHTTFLENELSKEQSRTKEETQRANRNAEGWIDSEISAKERAEKAADWLRDRQQQNPTQ